MKHNAFLRGLGLALALTIIPLMGSGCGGEKEPAPAQPDEAAAPARAPNLAGPFQTAGLYGVPKGAPFVAVGSVNKLADALGYSALIGKYGALGAGFGENMVALTGVDLNNLARWAEVGVDLDMPMGVFMTDLETQALVTFVQLSDAKKMIDWVSEVARKARAPLRVEKVGTAMLLTVDDRDGGALAVRGTFGYAVNMKRGDGATAIAKAIIARKPEDSIAALPELESAMAGLGADEAGLFVQLLPAIFEKLVSAGPEAPAERKDNQTAQLAGRFAPLLEGNGTPAVPDANEAFGELRATLDKLAEAEERDRPKDERMAKRRAAELELVKTLVPELSTLAVGLDLSERAIEATIVLPLAKGGMLAGLFENAAHGQPILAATKDEPLFLYGGRLDPERSWALAQNIIKAEGGDDALEEAKAELQKRLGLDLEKDVIAQLTGELGFAITGDAMELFLNSDKEPQELLGGAIVVGVKSDEALKAVAAKLGTNNGVAKIAKWDAATSSLSVTPPMMRPVQIVFAGTHIVASTDMDTAARLAGGDSFVSSVTNPELKELFGRKDLAALGSLQHSLVSTIILGMGREPRPPPALPADASAKLKAMAASIEKLEAASRRLLAQVEAQEMGPSFDMFEKLGTQATALTMEPQGVRATYGLYTKHATLPEVLARMIELGRQEMDDGGPPSADVTRLRELAVMRSNLESDLLNAIRPKVVDELSLPKDEE